MQLKHHHFEKRLTRFVDSTPMKHLFYMWIGFNIIMAMVYFAISALIDGHHLLLHGEPLQGDIYGFLNCIYFSFVTSTTLGYGDIAPIGINKVFSMTQATGGLIILSFIISKLVSKKQEDMIQEIHHTSFEEHIRTLRSGIYHFRENIERLIEKTVHNHMTKRELTEHLNLQLMSFYTHTSELVTLLHDREQLKELEGEKLLLHFSTSLSVVIHCMKIFHKRQLHMDPKEIMESIHLIREATLKACKLLEEKHYSNDFLHLIERVKDRVTHLEEMAEELCSDPKKEEHEEE